MTAAVKKPQSVFRTFYAKLHVAGEGETLRQVRAVVTAVITAVGVAVQRTLKRLEERLVIACEPEGTIQSGDLFLPLLPDDEPRVAKLLAKPRGVPPDHASAKELARPRYCNSYHAEEVVEWQGQRCIRFRIAEPFTWQVSSESKPRAIRELELINATIGMQQLIQSWLRPDLREVPCRLRPGVCQQVAQQLLSHLGLLDSQTAETTSFPSCEERDPRRRLTIWNSALERVVQGAHPFLYQAARDLHLGRYAADDPRGDRLVNMDPDWVEFVRSPHPLPLPLNFVGSNDVVVYERRWCPPGRRGRQCEGRRLYAALPVFEGVDPTSTLGQLSATPNLNWWRERCDEFTPLPVWHGQALMSDDPMLVVPLQYDPDRRALNEQRAMGHTARRPSRFQTAFLGLGGRRVNWSLLVQRMRRRGERRAQPEWELHFATSRQVQPQLRPNVLGIHFGVNPILWWVLVTADGTLVQSGKLAGNEILDEGLRQKLRLEEGFQGKLRWVGERRYGADLRRRTAEVARQLVGLAAQTNANLALEEITWVDKRSGDSEANRRFSLWNYAALGDRIAWQGMERQVADDGELQRPDPVSVVARVSDYLLRFTCPQCGACRKAGEAKGSATTRREGDVLMCSRCEFRGVIPDDHQASLVATIGANRLRQRLRRTP